MERLAVAKVALSVAAYRGFSIQETSTEAFSILDREKGLVLEITPYRNLGVAQIVTMTLDQSRRIAEYSKKQSEILREMGRNDLFLDVTYVAEKNWNKATLGRIPAGSAVFPVLEEKTVPIQHVKPYLS